MIYDPKSDYGLYYLNFSQIKLEYFSSLKLLNETYKKSTNEWIFENEDYFCLIEEFQINVFLRRFKGLNPEIQQPLNKIEISLPFLNLNLSKNIYRKILKIKEHISFSEENSMEIAHNERLALLAKALKIGEVYKKTTQIGITNWSKYFCVLSGNYLYFFVHQKDINPHSNFYLKNAEIFEIEDKIKNNVLLVIFIIF